MDKPSADCRNSAKRRCLNNRDSDTLFVSKSPEPNAPNTPNARKQDSTADDISDEDDDVSESDDPVYDESDEPFPACPAFDPAINDIRVKSQASVKTLDSVLEQYVSVNKDLENMKAKTAEALKPPKSIRRSKRVALVGPTGAGNSVVHIKMFTCTNN
jgi:flagellar biosynthesis GTPase FlhF